MKRFKQVLTSTTFFLATALMLAGCHNHAQHQQHMQQLQEGKKHTTSIEGYDIPSVTLINQDRDQIKLQDIVNNTRPVLLQFIFADCTTICPVLSSGFSSLQKKMGPGAADIQLVSITIDPENDSPEVMKKYLTRYRAQSNWDFLTGSRKDIDQVMHAFNAYVSNKMSHYPLTFIRIPENNRWVRIDGLVGTEELLQEYHKIYPGKM